MTTIISQYADQDKVNHLLNNDPLLHRFAHEYCREFGTKVMEKSDSKGRDLVLVTADGLTVGHLGIHKDSGDSEPWYKISLPEIIKKSKASKRSQHGERDSNKISTLLGALKKHKEIPNRMNIVDKFKAPIRYALGATHKEVTNPQIRLPADTQLALVLKSLGVECSISVGHQQIVKDTYAKYITEKIKSDEHVKNVNRIFRGFTLVGWMGTHYLVTEGRADGINADNIHINPQIVRYNTLKDSPLAATVAMIRTYAEGKWDSDNELGLPWRDIYYPDIDIATGYKSHNFETGLWIVIPKHGE